MNGTKYSFFFTKNEKIKATKQDEVYFKMALSLASLSKDQQTKVGSVIVDEDRKVVSMGYNGCPSGFGRAYTNDSHVPHSREEKEIGITQTFPEFGINKKIYKYNKYPFMIHAEQNALLTCSDRNRLIGSTLYCTHYPCSICALLIAQSKIKNVKVLDNRHNTFTKTIVPTLYIYENMGITLYVFEKTGIL